MRVLAIAATVVLIVVTVVGTVTETVSLYQLFGYNLLVVGSVLALGVLVLIFRPDR
jgi:ubiquinone biosynthesis protein